MHALRVDLGAARGERRAPTKCQVRENDEDETSDERGDLKDDREQLRPTQQRPFLQAGIEPLMTGRPEPSPTSRRFPPAATPIRWDGSLQTSCAEPVAGSCWR